jgi:hypothetical protein
MTLLDMSDRIWSGNAAFTVYPIVLVKASDAVKASSKPRVFPYMDETARWDAAQKFLEDGATIRFEEPYETDGSEFDGKFGER